MKWFIGGDRRAYWTVDHLRKKGVTVSTYGVPGMEDQPLPEKISCLLLPFPVPNPWNEICHVIPRIKKDTLVIGGRLGCHREALEIAGGRIVDLYDTEPLTTLNAVATAEGALFLMMEASECTLWESTCLVVGGGRLGMVLGERLRDMGAHVTVSARSPKDLATIRSRGMLPEITGVYEKGLEQYDFVINTVPAPVLEEEQLSMLKKSCVLVELASAPGGFCRELCNAMGLKVMNAPGLPGRFSPKTAGMLYGDCILEVLK